MSNAHEKNIWKVNQFLNSIPTNTYIPTLEGHAATNKQETETLSNTFFPLPPPADLRDIPGAIYPKPVSTNLNVTMIQVK